MLLIAAFYITDLRIPYSFFPMAFAATHIRVAIDLCETLSIHDPKRYLAGTIYPDSRYITGLERHRTHPEFQQFLDASDDDFHAGWAVHLAVDYVQLAIIRRVWPFTLESLVYGTSTWVAVTAYKLVQDTIDACDASVSEALPLPVMGAPLGEDKNALAAYYEMVNRLYARKGAPAFNQYRACLFAFGMESKLIDRVFDCAKDIVAKPRLYQFVVDGFEELKRSVCGLMGSSELRDSAADDARLAAR